MSDRFEVCHAITAKWEGGWSDHKADPGGKTMYGVTEATYHAWLKAKGRKPSPVRDITMTEAKLIYRERFWVACGAPTLGAGVDLATYDASVNSGVSRGTAWRKAAADAAAAGDAVAVIKGICARRLSFMRGLKIWKTFGKGWGRRVADIEVKGVRMALEARGATDARIRAEAETEARKATKAAKTAQGGAVTSGTAGTAVGGATAKTAPGIDPAAIDWTAIAVLGSLVAIAAVVAVLFIVRARAQAERAAAYAAEAKGGAA